MSRTELHHARFVFPELVAESRSLTRFERTRQVDDGSWGFFWYEPERRGVSHTTTHEIPKFLREDRYRFTNLQPMQLLHCFSLGLLNAAGVYWLGQSLGRGGILEGIVPKVKSILHNGILPVLQFYAALFFIVPAGRLLLLLWWNRGRQGRNALRSSLVEAL